MTLLYEPNNELQSYIDASYPANQSTSSELILHMSDPSWTMLLKFGLPTMSLLSISLKLSNAGLQSVSLVFWNLSYAERLNRLQLQSLEHRGLLSDLVLCFNIVHGLIALPFDNFFTYHNYSSTRGHTYKLVIPPSKTNRSKFFFSSRVIPVWNSLPRTRLGHYQLPEQWRRHGGMGGPDPHFCSDPS